MTSSPDPQQQIDAIAADFRAALPQRLAALRAQAGQAVRSASQAEDQRLHGLLHALAGTAGTLGQPQLAEQVQALAVLVDRWSAQPPTPAERQALSAMIDMLVPDPHPAHVVPLSAMVGAPAASPGVRVTVVDDDPAFARVVAAMLEHLGCQVTCHHSPAAFTASLANSPAPDLLLLDLDFPEGPVAGAEAIAVLRLQGVPRVSTVCVSRHDDMASRLAAHRAGAGHYLVKPVDPQRLGALVDELTSAGHAPLTALLVDNDQFALNTHSAMLESAGIRVIPCTEPMETLTLARRHLPDVVVLDVYMPQVSGIEAAAVLRTDESLAWMPIVFLSAEPDARRRAGALAYGGDHFLLKPVTPHELRDTIRVRGHRARALKRMLDAHVAPSSP